MGNKLQSLRRHFYRQQVVGLGVIVIVAGIGIYFLVASHAATPYASSEAEKGTLNGATTITDLNASGGSAVQFGSNGTKAPGIYVSGNKLVNGKGQMVTLHGVNVPSALWACAQNLGFFQEPVDQMGVSAIVAWHANAVRVAVNEDCWLNINNVPLQYAGQNYITAVTNYINLLNQNGIYAILDLQAVAPGSNEAGTTTDPQIAMPDQDHAPAFWASAAATFKNNHAVLFDLYNEPFPDDNSDTPTAWSCWLNGGNCVGVTYNGTSYTAAGMQELVTTVRGAGASNVIMIGGIDYAAVDDQWLANEPTDPDSQLALSVHTYDFNRPCGSSTGTAATAISCYSSGSTSLAPIAQKVPVIFGEMGEGDCQAIYIDPIMTWADTNGYSYLGWGWDPFGCTSFPSLISDYSGTPTAFGIGFQQHYQSTFPADSPIQ